MEDHDNNQNIDGHSQYKSYLVIADESEEFHSALYYALRLADLNNGHVCIAHIQNLNDFMHWGNVEDMVRRDMRAQSEQILWNIAKECNGYNGQIPSLYSGEGSNADIITDIINDNEHIAALILGAGTKGSNPGPLIKHFSNKFSAQLSIPLIIVPGNLTKDDIKKLL